MEIEISKMGERGQVTIPQEFRKDMKLETGEKIVFIKEGGKLILKPMSKMKENIIEQLKEDLEFARRTEEAWKQIERGESTISNAEEYIKELEKWAKE